MYYKNCENKTDFIRGLFDGDGTICKHNKTNGGRIGMVISKQQPDIKKIFDNFCYEFSLKTSTYNDTRGSGC